ncbi:MAG: BamA/TamA family outer membrane protein [Bacteroidales bacterium]|nr:BamA/TamA family outer membrane protein [Bacteroidales bacterium]MBQ9309623.1 BamA/TamA family outer membrane protein [Bacteroidales bacterium]
MKKLLLIAAGMFACAVSAFASEGADDVEIKRGWSFGALPCATYSSDMGFQWGAFGDVYYYGDGNTYPDPLHKISWEASHYTKGRSRFYLAYDSKYLVSSLRVTASATYVTDPLYNFYGFNGSTVERGFDSYDADYAAAGGYYMKRNMLRLIADFQGVISPSLRWAGGISYWNFDLGHFDTDKYSQYASAYTTYQQYVDFSAIRHEEEKGGSRIEAKGGIVFDNRDIEAAPNRGIWAELYLNGSPDLFGDGLSYLKLCAHWRQYLSIPVDLFKAGRPVFAYHLAYQGTLLGDAPFYMQQNITALVLKQMISEGFGSYNTIRGTYTNRIIADGYAWGNFELRVKLLNFKLFGQYFYLATNPFFDCGMVVQPYRADETASMMTSLANPPGNGYGTIVIPAQIKRDSREFIYSAGAGLKLAWNQNFIISAEVAHCFTEGMGEPLWISIGTNYSF